jgi:hypothetical protein
MAKFKDPKQIAASQNPMWRDVGMGSMLHVSNHLKDVKTCLYLIVTVVASRTLSLPHPAQKSGPSLIPPCAPETKG